jgi:hypothetical protein
VTHRLGAGASTDDEGNDLFRDAAVGSAGALATCFGAFLGVFGGAFFGGAFFGGAFFGGAFFGARPFIGWMTGDDGVTMFSLTGTGNPPIAFSGISEDSILSLPSTDSEVPTLVSGVTKGGGVNIWQISWMLCGFDRPRSSACGEKGKSSTLLPLPLKVGLGTRVGGGVGVTAAVF